MRHQPTLRKNLIGALIKVINELVELSHGDNIQVVSTITTKTPEKEKERMDTASDRGFEDVVQRWSSDSSLKAEETVPPPKKETLIAEVRAEGGTSFQMVQENQLAAHDFMLLFARIVEAVLANSTAAENSNVMLECELPQLLLKFFSVEKPGSNTSLSLFTAVIPNIFRLLLVSRFILIHLVQQSRKIQPFQLLATAVRDHFQQFSSTESTLALLKQEQPSAALNRALNLASTFSAFNRVTLSNAHETRSLLFNYLATDPDGQSLIATVFDGLYVFGWSMATYHAELNVKNSASSPQKASNPNPATSRGSSLTQALRRSSAAGVVGQSSSASGTSSENYNIGCNIYKCLQEVIDQIARACNSTRVRRGTDPYQANTARIPEFLFLGLSKLLNIQSLAGEAR